MSRFQALFRKLLVIHCAFFACSQAGARENWSYYNPTATYPTPDITQAWTKGPCRDPWINAAYKTVFQRFPRGSGDLGECMPALYMGASWSSYNQLLHGIATSLRNLEASNLGIGASGAGSFIYFTPNTLGLNGSASIVAQGGGNIVAQGGGNIVAQGGGNLKGYRLQGVGGYVIPLSGASRIIFK